MTVEMPKNYPEVPPASRMSLQEGPKIDFHASMSRNFMDLID